MLTEVHLVHTPWSDGKLWTLRSPSPEGYGAPTWGSVFRLLYVYAANPGKLNGGHVKTAPGWAWACLHCGRERIGDKNKKPTACHWCKSRSLWGHDAPEFYFKAPSGRDYAGGIDLAEFAADWSKWVLAVSPDPRAFRAAECWAQGLGTHSGARYSGCSQRYALLAIGALQSAYDGRGLVF